MATPRQKQAIQTISDNIDSLQSSGDISDAQADTLVQELIILTKGCGLERVAIRPVLRHHSKVVRTQEDLFEKHWPETP